MYKNSGCLNEIVAMSNNKLKDTEDNRLAEQHQLLRKGSSHCHLIVYNFSSMSHALH